MLTAPVDASDLYISQRPLIDRTIALICKRNHVSAADTDDFRSVAHLHLIDRDYAVLRAYQGRADISLFLQAVLRRCFQNWRNANWGRWRPSVAARREGPVAIALETMVARDRRPLHEAIEVLRTNHGVTMEARELEEMAARLPNNVGRTFVSEDTLHRTLDESSAEYQSASALVDKRDAASAAARVSAALNDAMQSLPPQDQLLMRMRFETGASMTVISRVLGEDRQVLYRRAAHLLTSVREQLEASGVTAEEARDLLQRRGFELLEGGRS